MPRRSRQGGSGRVPSTGGEPPSSPFVELLRPAVGRELVLELEDARGVRLRLTLRDGGRWRVPGLDPSPGAAGA